MLIKGGCPKNMLSIRDAMEALEGRWKLLILFALSSGPKRFMELSREVAGISDKVLSKELKALETNLLVDRKAQDTSPLVVEYSITEHARSLEVVMEALHYWGMSHRKLVMGR